mmetsp:Transcript_8373/g.24853  ORF Transcript_8373/g.24853 Transcript_8373/m.24853 type:complete len:204 (+) Transcript_8373:1090-1701(+)
MDPVPAVTSCRSTQFSSPKSLLEWLRRGPRTTTSITASWCSEPGDTVCGAAADSGDPHGPASVMRGSDTEVLSHTIVVSSFGSTKILAFAREAANPVSDVQDSSVDLLDSAPNISSNARKSDPLPELDFVFADARRLYTVVATKSAARTTITTVSVTCSPSRLLVNPVCSSPTLGEPFVGASVDALVGAAVGEVGAAVGAGVG